MLGTKSYFPADTAPDVITMSLLDFKLLNISFLNFPASLSLNIFFSLNVIGSEFKKDFI